MDSRAPAVVAVVVTREPGPWFAEVLDALATQDYQEFSVLILATGGADPTPMVTRHLPGAFVGLVEGDPGFGGTANHALEMVEGASFFLLLHDDVALAPDAVHLLVEESFRSNAGVVGPKVVSWDDAEVLLHVGMNVDKTGAVVERVQPGEIDHGQHDGVRDVFEVPSGAILIRADLFKEIGGFDPGIVGMGEDLDLCWRAQVAGSRVIVAPDAVVRHLQAVTGGLRSAASSADEQPVAPTLQELQRRHELRAVLKCYGLFHLLRVLPQAALLALGEFTVALAVRDRVRARAIVRAWTWNLVHLADLRALRRVVREHRRLPDAEIRRLQLRGSARLSTYLSRLAHQGFDVAHGRIPTWRQDDPDATPLLTGSVGLAFSEDADFDELGDVGRAGRDRLGRRPRREFLGSRRTRLAVWMAAAILLIVGSRSLFGGGLPLVGQFAPLASWTGTWQHFAAGWHPAGVGTTAPATPAFAVLGVVGTVLFGAMGLVQKVMVLGCLPVGVWGMSRFLAPVAAPRGRLAGAISYLGLPLFYDGLATGRWDGLVAYAAMPWILLALCRSSGLAPFVRADEEEHPSSALRQMLKLGVIEALAVSFAPAVAIDVLYCGVGIVAASWLVGDRRAALRTLRLAIGATLVSAVLCGPWVIGTLAAGSRALGVFGLSAAPPGSPGWAELVRFAVGPIGQSPLSWLLIGAAFLPLLIGRHERLFWAARLWAIALLGWLGAFAVARHAFGSFAPSLDVLLAPAAVAVAANIGLGIASFEIDLSDYRFGWRQLGSGAAIIALVVGLFPVVAKSMDGRWGLAQTGYAEPLGFLAHQSAPSGFRVLWLGAPDALPLGGWSISPGLAYATSEDGVPDANDVWSPAGPGPSVHLADALTLALGDKTSHLGQLLAPGAVRYVVVVNSVAPSISGVQTATPDPPPADVVPSLLEQGDLQVVPVAAGLTVFENTAPLPERALRTSSGTQGAAVPAAGWPDAADVLGWSPALSGAADGDSFTGSLLPGTLFSSYAPRNRFTLQTVTGTVSSSPAFGWAEQFAVSTSGPAVLEYRGDVLLPLGLAIELALWCLTALVLVRRRRLVHAFMVVTGRSHRDDDDSTTPPGVHGAAMREAPARRPDAPRRRAQHAAGGR